MGVSQSISGAKAPRCSHAFTCHPPKASVFVEEHMRNMVFDGSILRVHVSLHYRRAKTVEKGSPVRPACEWAWLDAHLD